MVRGFNGVPFVTVQDALGNDVVTYATTLRFDGATLSRDDQTAIITVSGGAFNLSVEDDDVPVASNVNTLNFAGTGVTATDAGGGQVDLTIPGETFTNIPIEDDDVAVVNATTINFAGAGVVVTDAGAGQANVTISGGGSGVAVEQNDVSVVDPATTLNFTGSSVLVTDGGAGQANIGISALDFVPVADDSVFVVNALSLDFIGAGVTVTDGGLGVCDITIPGETFTNIPVEDDDVAIVGATTLNFAGAGVTVTDGGAGQANIEIPGGAGSAEIFSPGPTGGNNSAGNATRGNIFIARENITINSLVGTIDPNVASAEYRGYAMILNGSNVVQSIEKSSIVVLSDIFSLNQKFDLASPLSITSGDRVCIMVGRTNGLGTDPANLAFTSAVWANYGFSNGGINAIAEMQVTDINVSDTILTTANLGAFGIGIYFER